MNWLKNILSFGLSLTIANTASAQPDEKREVKEIYFNINYTHRVNDTIVAFLDKYIVSDEKALPKPFVYAFYSCLLTGFW